MSNNSQRADVIIVFNGQAMGLAEVTKQVREELAGVGGGATKASADVAHLGEAEGRAGKDARNLAEAVRIASESVGMLGVESGETYGRLMSMRAAAGDFTKSMGGMKTALLGGMGLTAAFAGLDFLKESVKDSLAGEQATQQLQAALRKTPGAFEETNKAIEEGASSWAKYGLSIGAVKASVAQGVGAGIKAETILGNPKQIADLAVALGERVPDALHEIERGGRGAERVIGRLNLSIVAQRQAMQQLGNPHFSADDRTRFLLDLVQKTAFSGQGDARTKSAQGSIDAFNASMGNLKETVGTDLLPALTDFANTLAGTAQGANAALAGVGGLGNVLQATYKPVLGTLLVGFLGLKLAHSQLGDLLRGRLMGDVAATTGKLVEESGAAITLTDAINSIPKTALTTAIFDAAAGTAIKEPWIANVLSVPKVAVTTAAFENAGAVAALGAEEARIAAVPRAVSTVATVDTTQAAAAIAGEEGQLAAIPRAVTTTATVATDTASIARAEAAETSLATPLVATASVVTDAGSIARATAAEAPLRTPIVTPVSVAVGALPVIAVSTVATVATVALSQGWLKPVTDGLGNLIAHVTGASVGKDVHATVDATANVKDATVQTGVIATVDGKATIADVQLPQGKTIKVHASATSASIDLPKGTTLTVTGHANVTSATAAPNTKVTVYGEAEVNGVQVPKGKKFTVSNITGTVQVDAAAVAAGKTLVVNNVHGTAQIDQAVVARGKSLSIGHVGGTAVIDSAEVARGKKLSVGNVSGTAVIDNATIAKGKKLTVGNVGGTAVIDNATIAPGKHLTITTVHGTAQIDGVVPAPGKTLVIGGVHGNAQIDGVHLKKGATVHVEQGTATINTLEAKAVKIVGPAINNALGFGSKEQPAPYYFKPTLAPGSKWPTPPAPGGGGGGGVDVGGLAGSLGLGILESIITAVIFRKMMGGGGGNGPGGPNDGAGIKDMLGKLVPKGTKLPGGQDAVAAVEDFFKQAPTARPGAILIPKVSPTPPRDVTHSDPSLFKIPNLAGPLKETFTNAFKSGGVIAAVGLGLAGLFKSGPAIAAAGRGLAGTMDAAFGSLIALITFPLKGLKTSNKPGAGGGQQVAAAYAGAGLDLAILGFGKAIVGKIGDGIKSKLADLLGIGKWIIDSIKAGIKGLAPRAPKGANTDTRTYGHGSGGKPPTGHPRGEGHWIPVSGNTWVWAPGKPPGHPGNTAGLTPGASGIGGHGVALAHVDTAMLTKLGAIKTPAGAHHAAATGAHGATPHHTERQQQTINVGGIHINGAQDPHAVAKEVVEALKSVSSAAHRKRQHGR